MSLTTLDAIGTYLNKLNIFQQEDWYYVHYNIKNIEVHIGKMAVAVLLKYHYVKSWEAENDMWNLSHLWLKILSCVYVCEGM